MAGRFVSIWFPHLVTDWHAVKQPALKKAVFVLKAHVHNRALITAASPRAQEEGIAAGMLLADAKALYPNLHCLDEKPGMAEQLLQRIAEWCIRFTPVAAPDPPAGILLDATGCTHLWGSEEAYLNDIRRRLSARGYTTRVAIADTIGCAWAVARYAHQRQVVDGGEHREILGSLPVSSLRLDSETVVRLHKLGLRQVQQLVTIPRSSLRRRFGSLLLKRLQQVLGEEAEFIQPVYPVEAYQERLPCLEPIQSLTGVEIALQQLLQAICTRLQKEGKGLRKAFFRGYRINGGATGIEIGTNRPSQSVTHLFQLFCLKLSAMEPKEGIELFLLEATLVENCEPVQERLWEQKGGLHDPEIADLIDRLTTRLGPDSVQRFLPAEHWWPERSYKPARSLDEVPTTGWKLDCPLPLQLLSPPERIEVMAPVPDYPPLHFRYKNQLHKIVKADGPERIEQEWWISDGEHRDYYSVEDEEGRRYWIFRSGHYNEVTAPQWFLHGFFA